MDRRSFLQGASVAGLSAAATACSKRAEPASRGAPAASSYAPAAGPCIVTTWKFGAQANAEALKILSAGGRALDAVEAGIAVVESDPGVDSVGYGGLPDASGEVTLDACIMEHRGECGSVAG